LGTPVLVHDLGDLEVYSAPVFFIAQPKNMPKTSRPKASVATSGIVLSRANQPGKWTRAKSEEEARLPFQKHVVRQNPFKRKPLKKISSTSVAGDRTVNRTTAGATLASIPSPTTWSSSKYQTAKSVPASGMTYAKFA
jgi:hypothetical protein